MFDSIINWKWSIQFSFGIVSHVYFIAWNNYDKHTPTLFVGEVINSSVDFIDFWGFVTTYRSRSKTRTCSYNFTLLWYRSVSVHGTLCLLDNFSCYFVVCSDIFQKRLFRKILSGISNSLDPDQARQNNLVPNCNDTNRQKVNLFSTSLCLKDTCLTFRPKVTSSSCKNDQKCAAIDKD